MQCSLSPTSFLLAFLWYLGVIQGAIFGNGVGILYHTPTYQRQRPQETWSGACDCRPKTWGNWLWCFLVTVLCSKWSNSKICLHLSPKCPQLNSKCWNTQGVQACICLGRIFARTLKSKYCSLGSAFFGKALSSVRSKYLYSLEVLNIASVRPQINDPWVLLYSSYRSCPWVW